MKSRAALAILVLFCATRAFADPAAPPPKTVSYTQEQLLRLLEAEKAMAVAIAARDRAADVYQLTNSTFAPPPPAKPPQSPAQP
jgi:hypothetical protein